jgi:glycosyltransferase involved in cell wall biosynthesis
MGDRILERTSTKIVIITDAWEPQVNGVVRTYQNTIKCIDDVKVIHPYLSMFKRVSLPGYKEIEVATNPWKMTRNLRSLMNSYHKIHIATEGPLGLYARMYLQRKGYPFTTSFHTLFPEFIQKRTGIPAFVFYPYFKWFHSKSTSVLAPTHSMETHLTSHGIKNVKVWSRGVDSSIFNPSRRKDFGSYIVCVSRVSKEKGLDDFCNLDYNRKILVGDGPYLDELKNKYPSVEMVGKKQGIELAELIASADAFVFPSKSDTFGIVILESISCGTPVVSYLQPGPKDVIINHYNGMMGDNLQENLSDCIKINRNDVYESSKQWTWERATKQFLEAIND